MTTNVLLNEKILTLTENHIKITTEVFDYIEKMDKEIEDDSLLRDTPAPFLMVYYTELDKPLGIVANDTMLIYTICISAKDFNPASYNIGNQSFFDLVEDITYTSRFQMSWKAPTLKELADCIDDNVCLIKPENVCKELVQMNKVV